MTKTLKDKKPLNFLLLTCAIANLEGTAIASISIRTHLPQPTDAAVLSALVLVPAS